MGNNGRDNMSSVRVMRMPLGLLSREPLAPPRKALILLPCCLSKVMLATPLLAALSSAFPEATLDWAVRDKAKPAISGNPRLRRLIPIGQGVGDEESADWPSRTAAASLTERLKREEYDTCFLPGSSGRLATVAWQAGIPQRIGLEAGSRSLANTVTVWPPAGERHKAARNLALAAAVGVPDAILSEVEAEFYPSDADRTAVTRWLVEELDWLGDKPLVIMHPGGGEEGPGRPRKRWPAVRFARLANHLGRTHGACVVLVGGPADREIATQVAGMMSIPAANQAGLMGLGEVAALGEVASVYVGNDAGPSHVVAASGCPSLVIFGPTDPAESAPYTRRTPIETLWQPLANGQFSWDQGVTVEQAAAAADRLLAQQKGPLEP